MAFSTWTQLGKSLLNKYEAHCQQHIERYPTVLYFTNMDHMRAKYFVKTSVNVTETRIDEGTWKKIVTQSVHLEEHCIKIETTFHLIYAPLYLTNLVFKFNTVFIAFFFFLIMSATIYLFAFWLIFVISLVLKFVQCLYAFYKE